MHEEVEQPRVGRLPYLPGVDGLRALAVVAVVLYHADVEWLPAGFLGVDVFFAISGFLITSLLVSEHAGAGTIALADFWRRRARRLLPGLFTLLAGVSLAALVVARDAAGRLAGDLPAAALYVSNWWQVVRGESYFEGIGRPPLLQHLWSLGVEEQFYVAAPLVLGALLARRIRRGRLAVGAVGLALLSALWMAVLWSPAGDASRLYFGTDTHAAALLLGVALGLVWRPQRLAADIAAGARRIIDGAGVAALAGLGYLAATADEFGSGLYRGGFLVAAALSTVAVAVAAHPAARLGRLLGTPALVWLGRRSYALYLWHWPVVVLTRPRLDVPLDGPSLLALRLAVSLALAELSFRFVEEPFRDGRAGAAFRRLRARDRRRVSATVLAGALGAWLAVALAAAPAGDVDLVTAAAGAETTLATWPSTTASTTTTTTATTAPTTAPAPTSAPTTAAPPPAPGPPAGPVLAIGDSVLLAARPALQRASGGMVQVDAAVGRQVWDVLDVLEGYRANGAFAALSAVVVHLGTNGPLSPHEFDRLVRAVEGVPRVVVLNVRVPRRWEEQSNASVRDGVARHPAVRLVDWYAASGQPGMLGDDGVHPTPLGADTLAQLVLAQLQGLPVPPPPPTTTTSTTAPPPPPTTAPTTAPPPPPTTPAPPPPTTAAPPAPTTATTEPPTTAAVPATTAPPPTTTTTGLLPLLPVDA